MQMQNINNNLTIFSNSISQRKQVIFDKFTTLSEFREEVGIQYFQVKLLQIEELLSLERVQTTQNNPELCFMLVPNWNVLKKIPWTKISKPVNTPSLIYRLLQTSTILIVIGINHVEKERLNNLGFPGPPTPAGQKKCGFDKDRLKLLNHVS